MWDGVLISTDNERFARWRFRRELTFGYPEQYILFVGCLIDSPKHDLGPIDISLSGNQNVYSEVNATRAEPIYTTPQQTDSTALGESSMTTSQSSMAVLENIPRDKIMSWQTLWLKF